MKSSLSSEVEKNQSGYGSSDLYETLARKQQKRSQAVHVAVSCLGSGLRVPKKTFDSK